MVLLLFALTEFPFASETLLEALSQKCEEVLRRPELQSVAGIHFFYRPFEMASCRVCLGSESHYERSAHIGSLGCLRNERVAFPLNFRDVYPSGPVEWGR